MLLHYYFIVFNFIKVILNMISFIIFQYFDLLIVQVISFIKYIDLLIAKKLINLNSLTCYYGYIMILLYLLLFIVIINIMSFIGL